jgi:betaine-aldehyde dehydrogenase
MLAVVLPPGVLDVNCGDAGTGRGTGRPRHPPHGVTVGAVWINTHIPFVSEMPHGGFKHSGYGKDLSVYGFEDYTRIKHVMSYIGE